MTTTPDAADGLTLRYVREELHSLRGSVRDDVASVRNAVDGLASELRNVLTVQGPRLAVLESRADAVGVDVTELRANNATLTTRVGDLERRAATSERDVADLRTQLANAARNRATWLITTSGGAIVAAVAAILAVVTR